MEKRDVAVFDVPGAYLHTDITEEKRIFLRIRYEFLDTVWEVNTYYKPYIQYDNGKKVLYVKFLIATYGHIESALLC